MLQLSVEHYVHMKLFYDMSDQDILEECGYSRESKRAIRAWKRKNGIALSKSKLPLLNDKLIKQQLRTHSIAELSRKYNICYDSFHRYVTNLYRGD